MTKLLRICRRAVLFALGMRGLPLGVAAFQCRAALIAIRSNDDFARVSATRARNLKVLLAAAEGRRRVVELGTGSAWTTISLALADPTRLVDSYDVVSRPRERYLRLVGPACRSRLRFFEQSGEQGPGDVARDPVDLLYIDSSHGCEETIREVEAWRPVLAPAATIVFDDYAHPDYPGVREAIEELGLRGEPRGDLFLHRT